MRHHLFLLASSALLAAAACSPTIDVTPTPTSTSTVETSTGTGATGTGGTATGTGGTDTGGTGTGGSVSTGGSTTTGTGGSTLLLQAFGGTAGEVAAQIPLLEPGVGQEATCAAPVAAGACQITSCALGGIGSPGPGFGNFGPMSASVGTTTVAIPYNGFGYPTVDFPSSVALGTGGTMTFRGGGSGADIPEFAITATIPGLGVITSPVPATSGGAAVIDTTQDLTVTWIPISIGQIKFGLDGGNTSVGGVAVSVSCTFEGAAGSGVVSRTLLSSLKAMSVGNPTYGGLSSELDTTTVIDGLTIETQSFQTSPTTGHDFQVTLE